MASTAGGALTAVAPLIGRRVRGVWRFVLPGAGELGEPVDLAWRDRPGLGRLAVALVRGGHPLHLPRVRADSPLVEALARAARGRALCWTRPAPSHRFITLDESWIDPEQHLLAIDRRRLERARQAAERVGPLATEIHSPDLCELPELLDRTLELDRLMQAAGPYDVDSGRRLDQTVFYRHYAEAACVDGTLRICFLRAGSRLAAAWLAVESAGSFWLLKAASDPGLSACWPAQLLAHDAIRYAAEANLESLEFWGRPQTWMRSWTAARRRCVSISLYPIRLEGLAALAADAVAALAHRWQQRKPKSAFRPRKISLVQVR